MEENEGVNQRYNVPFEGPHHIITILVMHIALHKGANMKKRNVVCSLFGVSVLAALLLAGCSGLTDPLKKAKITFDPSQVECRLSESDKNTIPSGTMIAENTALYFEAKNLPQGKTVKTWQVNNKDAASGKAFLYYVNLKELELKKGAEIKVGFTTADVQKVTVTFKTDKVLAYNQVTTSSGNPVWGTTQASDKEWEEGSVIRFVAKPEKGKAVAHWFINDRLAPGANSNGKYDYEVKLDDAKESEGKKIIDVRFEEKEAKAVITFDEAKVQCFTDRSHSMEYLSGKEVELGTQLYFKARLDAGKAVENWYVNTVKQENKEKAEDNFTYTVDAADLQDVEGKKTVNISYTFVDEEKVTVTYDSTKVFCSEPSGGKWAVGQTLSFYAKLGENESVVLWQVNGQNGSKIANSDGLKAIEYTVSLEDAKDGKADISYTTTTIGTTVNFATNKIWCAKPSGKTWGNGEYFEFRAKLAAGDAVENWYVNGKKQNHATNNTYWYQLNKNYAKDGKIEITYTLASKITIKFDNTKVKVTKNYPAGEEIANGAVCTKGTQLYLTALNVEAGKEVDKWTLNDVKNADPSLNSSNPYFTVATELAKTEKDAKVITIGYTVKDTTPDTEKIKVTFESTVTCERYDDATSTWVAVTSGDEIQKAAFSFPRLRLTATLQAGEQVRAWRVNGVEKYSNRNPYEYNTNRDAENDFEGGVRTLHFSWDKK